MDVACHVAGGAGDSFGHFEQFTQKYFGNSQSCVSGLSFLLRCVVKRLDASSLPSSIFFLKLFSARIRCILLLGFFCFLFSRLLPVLSLTAALPGQKFKTLYSEFRDWFRGVGGPCGQVAGGALSRMCRFQEKKNMFTTTYY